MNRKTFFFEFIFLASSSYLAAQAIFLESSPYTRNVQSRVPQLISNFVNIAQSCVSQEYFTPESRFTRFYQGHLKLFEFSARYLVFLRRLCDTSDSRPSHILFPYQVPSAEGVPLYYNLHYMVETLDKNVNSVIQQKDVIWKVANDILNLIYDELRGLLNVEWSSPVLYHHSVLFITPNIHTVLASLSSLISPIYPECTKYLPNLKPLHQMLLFVPSYMSFLDNILKDGNKESTSHSTPAAPNPQHKSYTLLAYNDKDKTRAIKKLRELLNAQHLWITPPLRRGSHFLRYSSNVRMGHIPTSSEFFTPFKLHIGIQLKMGKDLRTIKQLSLYHFVSSKTEALNALISRHFDTRRVTLNFFSHQITSLAALMPKSLQFQSTIRVITLRGFLHHSLSCSTHNAKYTTYGHMPRVNHVVNLYLGLPLLLPQPVRIAQRSIHEPVLGTIIHQENTQAVFKFYSTYFSKDLEPNLRDPPRDPPPVYCEVPPLHPFTQRVTNIQYPPSFQVSDPSHLLCVACFGLHPEYTQFTVTTTTDETKDSDESHNDHLTSYTTKQQSKVASKQTDSHSSVYSGSTIHPTKSHVSVKPKLQSTKSSPSKPLYLPSKKSSSKPLYVDANWNHFESSNTASRTTSFLSIRSSVHDDTSRTASPTLLNSLSSFIRRFRKNSADRKNQKTHSPEPQQSLSGTSHSSPSVDPFTDPSQVSQASVLNNLQNLNSDNVVKSFDPSSTRYPTTVLVCYKDSRSPL